MVMLSTILDGPEGTPGDAFQFEPGALYVRRERMPGRAPRDLVQFETSEGEWSMFIVAISEAGGVLVDQEPAMRPTYEHVHCRSYIVAGHTLIAHEHLSDDQLVELLARLWATNPSACIDWTGKLGQLPDLARDEKARILRLMSGLDEVGRMIRKNAHYPVGGGQTSTTR